MVVTAEYWKRVFPGIMLGSNIQFPSRTLARPCCKQPFRGSFSLNSSDSLVGEHRSHSLGTDIQESQVNYARPRCALGFRCLTLLGAIDQRFASIKLLAGACCILVAWATDRFRAGRSEPSSKSRRPGRNQQGTGATGQSAASGRSFPLDISE